MTASTMGSLLAGCDRDTDHRQPLLTASRLHSPSRSDDLARALQPVSRRRSFSSSNPTPLLGLLDVNEDALLLCLALLPFTSWVAARAACRRLDRVGLALLALVDDGELSWPVALQGSLHARADVHSGSPMQLEGTMQVAALLLRSQYAAHLQSLSVVLHAQPQDGPQRIFAGLEQLLATIVSSRAVTSHRSFASVHTLHIVTAVNMQRFDRAFINSARWCPVEPARFAKLLRCMPSLTALHLTNEGTANWPLLPCLKGTWCCFPAVAPPFIRLFAGLRSLQLRVLTIPAWASNECIGYLLDAHAFEQYERIAETDQQHLDAFRPCADVATFELSACARSLEEITIECASRPVARAGLLFDWLARLTQLKRLGVPHVMMISPQERYIPLAGLTGLTALDLTSTVQLIRVPTPFDALCIVLAAMPGLTSLGMDSVVATMMNPTRLRTLHRLCPALTQLSTVPLAPGHAELLPHLYPQLERLGVCMRKPFPHPLSLGRSRSPFVTTQPVAEVEVLLRGLSLVHHLTITELPGHVLAEALLLTAQSRSLRTLAIVVDREVSEMAVPPHWRSQSHTVAGREARGGAQPQTAGRAVVAALDISLVAATIVHHVSFPRSPSSFSSLTSLTITAPFIHRDMLAYVLSLRSLRSLHLATDGNAFAFQPALDDGRGLTDAHLLALHNLPELSELRLDGLPMLTLVSLAALSFCRSLRSLVIERCNGLNWADRDRLALGQYCGTAADQLAVDERVRAGDRHRLLPPAAGLDEVHLRDNDALPNTCATDVRRLINDCSRAIQLTEREEVGTKLQTRTLNLARCTMATRLAVAMGDIVDGLTRPTQIAVAVRCDHTVNESRPQRASFIERFRGFFSKQNATK